MLADHGSDKTFSQLSSCLVHVYDILRVLDGDKVQMVRVARDLGIWVVVVAVLVRSGTNYLDCGLLGTQCDVVQMCCTPPKVPCKTRWNQGQQG